MTETADRPRRPLWIVTGLLLAGTALLWGSSRLIWSSGAIGAEQVPALQPLALIYLAGIAGVLATSGWPRRVVGVLLALTGFVAGWLAVSGAFHQGQFTTRGLLAGGLALLAGVVVLWAGWLLVRSGHRMPRLGASYQTPAAAKSGPNEEKDLAKYQWRALSEGDDPTI